MAQQIRQLQRAEYDKRTDQIRPLGHSESGLVIGYVQKAGYTVVEPLLGWSPYTHLIEADDFDLGHRYYLAELTEVIA